MKTTSITRPEPRVNFRNGSYLRNTNIVEKTRTNFLGKPETYYEYDSELMPPVPEKVAAYRVKFVAGQYGLSVAIDAFIEALPEDMKELAHAAWNYGTDILRNSILLSEFCTATGTDPEIIDDIFRDAYNLNI